MIVLDTHALVWWVSDPKRIPARARRLIAAEDAVAVSSISLWEIAMLADRKRLAFTMEPGAWIAQVEALPGVDFIPVDNDVAVRSVQLAGFPHRDPADRMIVATAIGLGATLITADARIRAYRPVRSAWD